MGTANIEEGGSMGAYVSPERVVRNGRLVAYKGEVMTESEAEKRGIGKTKPKPKAGRAAGAK